MSTVGISHGRAYDGALTDPCDRNQCSPIFSDRGGRLTK